VATRSVEGAVHICPLCDDIACPEDACPVHRVALEFAERDGGATA